ncbi:hypothetical protein GCM10018790_75340 [Kitasatospora xanthocidica]|nr:hypothetical protein GCM10018790_75340 [Kitasatospora xanthocidica]
MSVVGSDPVEYGRCVSCEGWGWGRWIEDLTASVALVQHCRIRPLSNGPQDDVGHATMVGPHHQQEEDA